MNAGGKTRRALWITVVLGCLGGVAAAQPAAPGSGGEAEAEAAAAQRQQAVQKLFQIMKSEPTVKEVQRDALRFYRLEPERIDSMATAARLKGLVPEIEGSFDSTLGHTYTNTRDGLYPILPNPPENPNPDYFKERVQGSNDQLVWRVRAVWNLDRLVFNSEALDVRSLNSIQENLVREVTTLFFARRRLLASLLLSPPAEDEELFYELMRLDELTATLDALSGGTFAKRAWKWDDDGPSAPDKDKDKDKGKKQ